MWTPSIRARLLWSNKQQTHTTPKIHLSNCLTLKERWFPSYHEHGTKKKFRVPMRNRIPRFDALPLSHRDSTVSEVYYEVLFTNITLSTLLILAVRRTRVIWTSSETSLTMESLWLSGRASESGIRRSEVRFVIGTQKFSLFHARDKTKIIFISLPSSSTQDRGHSFSQYGPTTKVGIYAAVHESVTVSRGQR